MTIDQLKNNQPEILGTEIPIHPQEYVGLIEAIKCSTEFSVTRGNNARNKQGQLVIPEIRSYKKNLLAQVDVIIAHLNSVRADIAGAIDPNTVIDDSTSAETPEVKTTES